MDISVYIINKDWYGLGNLYYYNNQFAPAINYFIRHLDCNTTPSYDAMVKIGQAYYIMGGRHLSVQRMAQWAKAFDPDYADAYYLLSTIAIERGQWLDLYENSKIGITKQKECLGSTIEWMKFYYALALYRLDLWDELRSYLQSVDIIVSSDYVTKIFTEIQENVFGIKNSEEKSENSL